MSETGQRYCVDCKNYRHNDRNTAYLDYAYQGGVIPPEHECTYGVDEVTGRKGSRPAHQMRRMGACGAVAVYFSPKEPTPT